ncbi:MAG: aspartate-semialdehyde dehydrogenase [Bdellovibrionales bacterium]|nr:aspartate-semialdehyde dehydrogenase [Bdellovibrionales bacterium]
MSQSKVSVAVVGATGAVGREMLAVLAERGFPVSELRPLASKRSAGSEIEYDDRTHTVEELTPSAFEGIDIALFSAGGDISKEFAPHAVAAGAVVIDNSSAFRMDDAVPLTVPEVNADELRDHMQGLAPKQGTIIANPNCSTIQLAVALKPLHDRAGLKRVVVSTYQSVSGAGQKGMDELWEQTVQLLNQKAITPNKFPHQIAFNCLPHIDVFLENGYTKEEMKVVLESRKILGLPELPITCTAVRVPVFACHSESVNVETERPLSPEEARELLTESPGIVVLDAPGDNQYPMNFKLAGSDATYVGRIRKDESVAHGLNMWVVADNLRKGAALNAVQIAEIVAQERNYILQ